jgi:hypothetical protein
LSFFNIFMVFFWTRVFIYNKLHYSLLLYICCVNYWYNLLGVQLNLWLGDFILNCFNLRVGQGMHYESHHFADKFGVLTRFTPNSNHSKSFVVGIYCLYNRFSAFLCSIQKQLLIIIYVYLNLSYFNSNVFFVNLSL